MTRNEVTPRRPSAALTGSLVDESLETFDAEASTTAKTRQFALPLVCGALLAGIVIGFIRKRR